MKESLTSRMLTEEACQQLEKEKRQHDLQVIRAFVERVEERALTHNPRGTLCVYDENAIRGELAALEKETK